MKTAIITGASRGIGMALAIRAVDVFDGVVTIGRTAPAGLKTVHISARFDEGGGHWCDAALARPEVVGASELFLFDNAAVLDVGASIRPEFAVALDEALKVNLVAPLALAHGLVRHVGATGAALTVIHITTGAAGRAIPGWGSYCISKAAAAMAFRMIESEHPGVRVRLVDPGAVDTAMQAALRAARDPSAAPQDRLVSAETAVARIFAEAGLA